MAPSFAIDFGADRKNRGSTKCRCSTAGEPALDPEAALVITLGENFSAGGIEIDLCFSAARDGKCQQTKDEEARVHGLS